MDLFEGFEVHESGRPILLPGEVEILVLQSIELSVAELVKPDLVVRLTTHRILFQKLKEKFFKQLKMPRVLGFAFPAHGWFSKSNLIKIILHSGHECQLVVDPEKRDTIATRFFEVLKAKHWEEIEQVEEVKKQFTTAGAGIAGILKQTEDDHTKTKESLSKAFLDLNTLMENAKSMVALAQKLKERHPSAQDSEVNNLMLDIGIDSPVTKETSGSLFHTEIARQVCQFLKVPLSQNNGIMTLSDVYCLYNRARGTSLISPEDLYRACLLFDELGLPVLLKEFKEEGLKTIQSIEYSDSLMKNNIQKLIGENCFPMTISQFSTQQKVPLSLSKHFLIKAEQDGILCRDESIQGLIFYQNIF